MASDGHRADDGLVQYVLSAMPAEFATSTLWSSVDTHRSLIVAATFEDGLILNEKVDFSKLSNGFIYLGNDRTSRRDIDTQIYCGGRSFN
jgi:hypothetical protein